MRLCIFSLTLTWIFSFSEVSQAQWTNSWDSQSSIESTAKALRETGSGIYCRTFSDSNAQSINDMNQDLQRVKERSGVSKMKPSPPQISDKASGGTLICITLYRES